MKFHGNYTLEIGLSTHHEPMYGGTVYQIVTVGCVPNKVTYAETTDINEVKAYINNLPLHQLHQIGSVDVEGTRFTVTVVPKQGGVTTMTREELERTKLERAAYIQLQHSIKSQIEAAERQYQAAFVEFTQAKMRLSKLNDLAVDYECEADNLRDMIEQEEQPETITTEHF